jgi:hypothetical protein
VNRNILQRTRIVTLVLAAVLAVVLGLLVSWDFAAGVLVTAVWAVAGFWILERLLRASVLPPGTPRNVFAIVLWGAAKLAIYAVAVWVLFVRPFPALSHIVGLTLLLVVLVVQGAMLYPRHAQHQQPVRRGEDG